MGVPVRPGPNIDYRVLARRQRWILWLLLFVIASQFTPLLLGGGVQLIVAVLATIVQIGMYIVMLVGVVLLLAARRTHVAIIIVCGFLMLAPCVNLLVLVFVNMSVTSTLRKAGLHVGFMGVKDEEVVRLTSPHLCSFCGYNLTGNVSGFCPECGRPVV